MVKPRGKVIRSTQSEPATGIVIVSDGEFKIAAWQENEAGPCTQVHLLFPMQLSDFKVSLAIRFKSPDTLGFLIEELSAYRREVWPDAEPLELNPSD